MSIALAFIDRDKLSEIAIDTLSKLISKHELISRLYLNHEYFMYCVRYYSIIDFLKYLSDDYLLKISSTLINYIDNEQNRHISLECETLEHQKFFLGYEEILSCFFYNSSIPEGTTIGQLPLNQKYIF